MSATEIRKLLNLFEGVNSHNSKEVMRQAAVDFIKSRNYKLVEKGSVIYIAKMNGRPVLTPMTDAEYNDWLNKLKRGRRDRDLLTNEFLPKEFVERHEKMDLIEKVGNLYMRVYMYHDIYLVDDQLIGKIGSVFYTISTNPKTFGQTQRFLGNNTPHGLE